jgi:hypothetical protein
MAKRKTAPKKKTTARKPKIDPVFQARWTEFAGQPFNPAKPAAIVSTVAKAEGAAIPLLAAAGPPIELWGNVREPISPGKCFAISGVAEALCQTPCRGRRTLNVFATRVRVDNIIQSEYH